MTDIWSRVANALAAIRSRVLVSCLALTLLTVMLGAYSQIAQRQLADLAIRIYDDAFMSVSYLRAAQLGFTDLAHQVPDSGSSLSSVTDDLDVAGARAMSDTGRQAVARLREHVSTATSQDFAAIQNEFESVVEIFADDGFRYRREITRMVAEEVRRTWAVIAGSLLAALVITGLVTRMIAPPVRRAARVAQAIAAGRLDNIIPQSGRGETADLLRALSVMQDNIAAAMDRIHGLMAAQASSHQSELVAQHAKLDAALENMNQGLCLFDRDNRLVMANRRFAEMFGTPELGASAASVLHTSGLSGLVMQAETRNASVFSGNLPDGRVIAVTQRPVSAGGWVATYEDITERRAAAHRLDYMARHDQLTGLSNRVVFHEHTARALASGPAGLAVMCIDLDRFKLVNDTLGHAAGDAVLRIVSRRLRDCTRDDDLVVRFGGDEFVVVQNRPGAGSYVDSVAARIVDLLSQPIDVGGRQVSIGASIGIALSTGPADTPETLLRYADIALYNAKAAGGGRFLRFEPAMDVMIQERRNLELDLKNAVGTDQFELYFQPLINADKGSIEGFEALVRWNRPGVGLVGPQFFIGALEEIGLIGELGRWVIEAACMEAASWPGAVKVAVNLSPLQFRSGNLAAQVRAALDRSGLAPARLELEITESVLLQEDGDIMETLFALRALGVRIAMDDFGTGYSSLSYLRRFPFDKIKIDQSFVRGMSDHEDCRAIVRSIIGLGRSLGMAVNAEGVETQEQVDALRLEGCDQLQGFLFSRPKPGSEVRPLLLQHGNATLALAAPAV